MVATKYLQRDYPRKSHIVIEHYDDGSVRTACGIEFGYVDDRSITTSDLADERDSEPPIRQARCEHCPWDIALAAVGGD